METTHHPFYPNELIEGCKSNPEVISNYLNKKVKYTDPKDKNYENACQEYISNCKVTNLFRKFFPL